MRDALLCHKFVQHLDAQPTRRAGMARAVLCSAVTIEFVEGRSGSLWCGRCRAFHDLSDFSAEQRRKLPRFCLRGKPKDWPRCASNVLTDEAIIDGAARCNLTLLDPPDADGSATGTSSRSKRAAERGPPQALPAAATKAPRKPSRRKTRHSTSVASAPRVSETARLNTMSATSRRADRHHDTSRA